MGFYWNNPILYKDISPKALILQSHPRVCSSNCALKLGLTLCIQILTQSLNDFINVGLSPLQTPERRQWPVEDYKAQGVEKSD